MKDRLFGIIVVLLILAVIYFASADQPKLETMDANCPEELVLVRDNLEKYSTTGETYLSEHWFEENVAHYKIQPDGRGLAMVVHPEAVGEAGSKCTVLFTTTNNGTNWYVLNEMFTYPGGASDCAYMGKTVVLAADDTASADVSILISYDRGSSWCEALILSDLVSYDTVRYPNLAPKIINYNDDTGFITFGWKVDADDEEYLLINQFDVNARVFTEEEYRNPEF